MTKKTLEMDPEIIGINDVYAALKELNPDAQSRILNYVAGKLNISVHIRETNLETGTRKFEDIERKRVSVDETENKEQGDDELDGISPVARKWMIRNGLEADKLSTLFSLGVDEIDLVAKTVPGKTKKERMHSVFLLKGVAAYLGTGAARFTHEQMKEACLHYDAFDAGNFAANFKNLASEVSGNKESGYTLSARGLSGATELIKTIISGNTG